VQSESFSCCLTGFVFRFLSSFFFLDRGSIFINETLCQHSGREREGQRRGTERQEGGAHKYNV